MVKWWREAYRLKSCQSVLHGHSLNINFFVSRCVSIFFVEFQLHFEKDYSSTAWIHSLIDSTTMLCGTYLQAECVLYMLVRTTWDSGQRGRCRHIAVNLNFLYFSAPVAGFLGNHFSCRATVMLGGLLSSAGLVLSSFASSLEHLYISLGILTGTQAPHLSWQLEQFVLHHILTDWNLLFKHRDSKIKDLSSTFK